jgi:hypothetical protein
MNWLRSAGSTLLYISLLPSSVRAEKGEGPGMRVNKAGSTGPWPKGLTVLPQNWGPGGRIGFCLEFHAQNWLCFVESIVFRSIVATATTWMGRDLMRMPHPSLHQNVIHRERRHKPRRQRQRHPTQKIGCVTCASITHRSGDLHQHVGRLHHGNAQPRRHQQRLERPPASAAMAVRAASSRDAISNKHKAGCHD